MGQQEDIVWKKKLIRKEVLAKRDALSLQERRRADIAMSDRIIGHQWFYRAEVLLAFVNYGSEISTEEIITEALRKGKKVYVPRVEEFRMADMNDTAFEKNKKPGKKELTMQFYRITSLEDLKKGYKNIREPNGSTECFAYEAYKDKKLLLLMPGAAFDIYGNRLGYGGGFYDRYLQDKPNLQTYSVGIGYKCQQIEELPTQEWDRKPYQVILM